MKNEFLRHTLSTIKYRFDKAIHQCKTGFGDFNLGYGSRCPQEIVHHMHDVLNWTRAVIERETFERSTFKALPFLEEVDRFRAELVLIDQALSIQELDVNFTKKLIQGPLSDVLTHIGQIAMLQRIHGTPIEGEDFSRSDIRTGFNE